jgi:hypothetical protein
MKKFSAVSWIFSSHRISSLLVLTHPSVNIDGGKAGTGCGGDQGGAEAIGEIEAGMVLDVWKDFSIP